MGKFSSAIESAIAREKELITLQLTREQIRLLQQSVVLSSPCFGKNFPCGSCGNEYCETLNMIIYLRGLLNS